MTIIDEFEIKIFTRGFKVCLFTGPCSFRTNVLNICPLSMHTLKYPYFSMKVKTLTITKLQINIFCFFHLLEKGREDARSSGHSPVGERAQREAERRSGTGH